MEQQINELIERIMKNANLNVEDLNKAIELHMLFEEGSTKIIDDSINIGNQMKRIEMAIREKLKQINIGFLDNEFLERLENLLFYRDSKADIKELRLINKNEIAIIRENEIELGDYSYDIENLDAGDALREEAYLCDCENEFHPEFVFPEFYAKMDKKIKEVIESLGSSDANTKIYFDRSLDQFYFENIKKIRVIVTTLPNIIKIYEVDTTKEKWIANRIDLEEFYNIFNKINFSLLEENIIVSDLKEMYKRRNHTATKNIDFEMALEEFKETPFSIESLLTTYINLFQNKNYMSEENTINITRLKFIVAEKMVQNGYDYETALMYSNRVFEVIKLYKNQIMDAMNGECSFPDDSLIGTVKKIKYPIQ